MYLLSDPSPSLFRLAVGRGLSGVVSPVSQKEKRKGEEEAAEKACLVCQSPLFSNCIGIAKAKSGASTMAIGEELAGSSFAILHCVAFPPTQATSSVYGPVSCLIRACVTTD